MSPSPARLHLVRLVWCAVASALPAPPAAAAAPAAAPPPPPTIEQLFGLPNLRQPRLSPDGKRIAFLYPHEKKLALGVFDRTNGESRLVVRGTDESIAQFGWKGNDRLVFLADYQGNESYFIGSTDLTGRNVIRIAETQPGEYLAGSAGGIVDWLRLQNDHVIANGLWKR